MIACDCFYHASAEKKSFESDSNDFNHLYR